MRFSWKRRKREQQPLEEIEYEPTTVRELLTEMKDVSELIVDLAYSAVLFGSEDMAEEVRLLEARMDTLNYQIRLSAMMAARTVEDAEGLTGILQVASAAEAISNVAGDIVDLLDVATLVEGAPGSTDEEAERAKPFLPTLLARADEKLKQFRLPQESPLGGRTLGELMLETETGMRVIAVRRGHRWIYGPERDTRLRDGDVLVLRGTDEGYEALATWAGVNA